MAYFCSGKSNEELVNNLFRARIMKSPRVRDAMLKVDRRHYSVDKTEAYHDRPHYIGFGATISAPHMHATALDELEPVLKEGAKVLDVGCGSGYLSAAMAFMVGETGKVYGLDHIEGLVELSVRNTERGNPELLKSFRVQYQVGDGFTGLPDCGPFDAIHVGAAVPEMPMALVRQLKPGGMMVLPLGRHWQRLAAVTKREGDRYEVRNITSVRFVPLTTPEEQLATGLY